MSAYHQNPHSNLIPATSIGSLALGCIQEINEATIRGIISRGIFIHTNTRWIVFLSYEQVPGPLTINVPAAKDFAISLLPGEHIVVQSGNLSFAEQLVVTTQHLHGWQPKAPTFSPELAADRWERIVSAANIIITKNKTENLSVLLPYIMTESNLGYQQPGEIPAWHSKILSLLGNLNNQLSAAAFIHLLGTGPGLTPSADDFIIGWLLAVNRWHPLLAAPANMETFNKQIIAAAYQRTTTLSANLIECAARGLADQRLVDALDWLMVGIQEGDQVIKNLLTWGNTSGVDAFVGFTAALCADK
jgi:hypothetical protein